MVMWGVEEDDTKGRARLPSTDRNDVNTSDHNLSNLVGLADSPSFGDSFVTFYSVLSGIFRIV